ncbi:MAG TPA: class I SAM-dependent methyltransferase [Flavobacteriaceae bacterium]|nr:class I SAM-dependent methyltransferase [Flavobacteriaceae bacterium]
MRNKENIINEIIERQGFENYLEIGYDEGLNFDRIKCREKYSVDPVGHAHFQGTSDDFFSVNKEVFDIIFIDGLHISDQVQRDIINSMAFLSEDGAIVIHDTIPKTKEMQEVPRNTKEWTGNVWRAVIGFHKQHSDVKLLTYKSDYGLTVIYPNGNKFVDLFEDKETTWEYFDKNKKELLKIVD